MITFINRQRKYPLKKDALMDFGLSALRAIKLRSRSARRLGDEFSLVFVSDRAMRRYNRNFRGKDRPTDVLSFPADSTEPEFASYLGDIIISMETAARDAGELGLTIEVELRMLIVHGLLHLCGYDHETDRGAMNRLESKLREQLLQL